VDLWDNQNKTLQNFLLFWARHRIS